MEVIIKISADIISRAMGREVGWWGRFDERLVSCLWHFTAVEYENVDLLFPSGLCWERAIRRKLC